MTTKENKEIEVESNEIDKDVSDVVENTVGLFRIILVAVIGSLKWFWSIARLVSKYLCKFIKWVFCVPLKWMCRGIKWFYKHVCFPVLRFIWFVWLFLLKISVFVLSAGVCVVVMRNQPVASNEPKALIEE